MDATRRAETEISTSLSQVLGEVPFLRIGATTKQLTDLDRGIDIAIDVSANGKLWKLLVEVKSSGEPRIARACRPQKLNDRHAAWATRPYSW